MDEHRCNWSAPTLRKTNHDLKLKLHFICAIFQLKVQRRCRFVTVNETGTNNLFLT